MTAHIIDGRKVSHQIKSSLKDSIAKARGNHARSPSLAVILVGQDKASALYVANKKKACDEVGIVSFAYHLPEKTTETELLDLIAELNQRQDIDGILVQLPLPQHINSRSIIEHISPNKDVDGFHPYNFGRLAQGHPHFRPCTPYGVIQLLNAYDISVRGKNAVIIGASNIVGRPMALELLMAGATISVCHTLTQNLEEYVTKSDIIVSATGVRHVIDVKWLQKKQILIDIGIHRSDEGIICGDIDFEQAKHKVSWITPVPGGVGPMTIATLLQNTFQAYISSQSNSLSNSPS